MYRKGQASGQLRAHDPVLGPGTEQDGSNDRGEELQTNANVSELGPSLRQVDGSNEELAELRTCPNITDLGSSPRKGEDSDGGAVGSAVFELESPGVVELPGSVRGVNPSRPATEDYLYYHGTVAKAGEDWRSRLEPNTKDEDPTVSEEGEKSRSREMDHTERS